MFNDNLEERHNLSIDRIKEISQNAELDNAELARFYMYEAKFIVKLDELYNISKSGKLNDYSLEELQKLNKSLYEELDPKLYDTCYGNPKYTCGIFGEDLGRLLSFLYVELRGLIVLAFEARLDEMVALQELFIECYLFGNNVNELKDAIYWYVSDYSDDLIEERIKELLDPDEDFATRIIMDSDLTDLRYLYKFGEYITDNELKTAKYLNSLSNEEINSMARTFTEGYRKGFELTGKDITKKKTVNIRFCLGFERLAREEIKEFAKIGLKPTIYRAAYNSINKTISGAKVGYYGAIANKQFEYDHKQDYALYFNNDFVERKLGATRLAYEKYKDLASVHGGPAVMEVFGETPFEPENNDFSYKLSDKQQKMIVKYSNEASAIVNNYIKGEERSFTIIAYPTPEIGDKFEEIFGETVKINTLDYDKYKTIQEKIIDALDRAKYVEVKGQNGNTTDIKVSIMKVNNPDKETVFENCLADVNIPLGETFTSPVLKGTTGRINVSSVFLNDLKFTNLTVDLKDGFVTDYSCDNFKDEDAGMEKGREMFKANVLYNHETLPMGEFAIGTNTTAYVMANKYDIVYKLPILIVEKMGPHFALGDTCYDRAEDVKVYNPNGKEIISRDNEVSILRKSNPDKAYYNCHTDITIPYDEIGNITVVDYDNNRTDIIRNGRFVLEGTLSLNDPFNE